MEYIRRLLQDRLPFPWDRVYFYLFISDDLASSLLISRIPDSFLLDLSSLSIGTWLLL
uniref:Uncharacterized protein n=1 Tax=Marmota marmota marmota TaxID=9994 RepID=A0A8C5Z7V3_MARMA